MTEDELEQGRQQNIETAQNSHHALADSMTQLLMDNRLMLESNKSLLENSKARGEQLDNLETSVSSLNLAIVGNLSVGIKGLAAQVKENAAITREHSKQIGSINSKLLGWGMVATFAAGVIMFLKEKLF